MPKDLSSLTSFWKREQAGTGKECITAQYTPNVTHRVTHKLSDIMENIG
jgi:hypothetical protein